MVDREKDERLDYFEREDRNARENDPRRWSWAELMRRIAERERQCGGHPF